MATSLAELISGSDGFADHMLRCYDECGILRLVVLADTVNSIRYIRHKEDPYRTAIRGAERGKVTIGENMLLEDVMFNMT